MSGVGFVIAAYVGTALLFGAYLALLLRHERARVGESRFARRGILPEKIGQQGRRLIDRNLLQQL